MPTYPGGMEFHSCICYLPYTYWKTSLPGTQGTKDGMVCFLTSVLMNTQKEFSVAEP